MALVAAGCGIGPMDAPDGFALPASHEVALLLNQVSGSVEFREAASEAGLAPLCATSGWQICLVQANETLVVVPFDNPGGTQVRITAEGLEQELVVPAEGNQPHGVPHIGGEVKVIVEDALGAEIGEIGGPVTEPEG